MIFRLSSWVVSGILGMEDSTTVKFQYGALFYLGMLTLMGTILNSKALFTLIETTKVYQIKQVVTLNWYNSDIGLELKINGYISNLQIQNTKHKFLIINLITSELAISCVGIPFDFYITLAAGDDDVRILCSSTAFIHTLFG